MKTLLDEFRPDIAVCITSETMVGVDTRYIPVRRGNCFSISSEQSNTQKHDYSKDYRVLNFFAENLRELIKQKKIDWPVKVLVNDTYRVALINDERIEDNWYQKHFCETCTPECFFPLPQLLRHKRQEARGEREVIVCDNGMKMIKQTIKTKSRKLDKSWTLETKMESNISEDAKEALALMILESMEKNKIPPTRVDDDTFQS